MAPTVIQAHGWGGLAAQLANDAVDLARAGYLVINFDYRGWGQSDGRVVLDPSGVVKGWAAERAAAPLRELPATIALE